MSGEGTPPFDPQRLASLSKVAIETQALSAPAPFPDPIVVDGSGNAMLPYPFEAGALANVRICAGVSLGWAPVPELGAVLLSLWGGTPETGRSFHNVTTTLTLPGLEALIVDLQAIAAAARAAT